MTWPARTWLTAELVTATIMNAYVRDPIAQMQIRPISFVFGDPNGDVILTGGKAPLLVPFSGTVIGWTVLADQVGSIVIDLCRDSYANYPPTQPTDSIAGSEKPTISASNKGQDLVLTTWAPTITSGDVIKPFVDSCSGIKQAVLILHVNLA